MNESWSAPVLPLMPHSWYFVCGVNELSPNNVKPFGFRIADKDFVAFRDSDGRVRVLSGRCCHFGSHLAAGRIVDNCIECPLHGWRFSGDGACRFIPAGDPVPSWAGQRSYPVTEKLGQIFFFYGEKVRFELPSFETIDEHALLISKPLFFNVKCPWYMIGANAFDGQHFRISHNRMPISPPLVERCGPDMLRIRLKLKILISNFADRFISKVLGPTIDFTVTNSGGNCMTVTSLQEGASTYAFLNVIPVGKNECRVVNVVSVAKSKSWFKRIAVDKLNSVIRREFIKRFLSAERPQLEGSDIVFDHCQPADRELRTYLQWLYAIDEDSRVRSRTAL